MSAPSLSPPPPSLLLIVTCSLPPHVSVRTHSPPPTRSVPASSEHGTQQAQITHPDPRASALTALALSRHRPPSSAATANADDEQPGWATCI
ncbi:hypothetical protein PHLCEN_2v8907 [Hermanssonia centrifuga]|uniref:Uncharacterized protein n=1 Tax=Hermanssonia centrifuga TaxID=98765 RepID=A0A2R6NT62_9APHY|nr:hypothetical protein PHLCEN_2v8907 [Hermanssonia centrifuga]